MAKKLKIYNGSSWEDVTFAITPPTTNVTNSFTTNQVIDASTSVAALRVTQRGSGEAFRVEDETNPDSTPFVIDASGNVGVGLSSLSGKLTAIANSGQSPLLLGMVSSDITSWIQAKIQRNNYQQQAAWLYVPSTVDSSNPTWYTGLNASSPNFVFSTYDSTTFAERMVITPAGNVGVGISTPIYKLQTWNENTSATIGTQALVFQAQISNGNQDFLKLYSERTLSGGASWSTQDWILRRHVDFSPMGGFKWAAGEWNPIAFYGAPNDRSIRTTYISTGTPSGGNDGDMWATYV